MNYKKFIQGSKYVTNYSNMGFFRKIIFHLEAPYRYLKFKKLYKKMGGK